MERQNSFPKNIWNIGIDIGYSAVKVMSPNAVCCFPSYAVMEESDSFSIDPLEKRGRSYLERRRSGTGLYFRLRYIRGFRFYLLQKPV